MDSYEFPKNVLSDPENLTTDSCIDSRVVHEIAGNFYDPARILDEISRNKVLSHPIPQRNHDETEHWIACLWSESLGTEINRNASFFNLGGHSLQAVQVLARINEHFAIEIPMHILFGDEFTVEGLTRIVTDMVADKKIATDQVA